MCGILLGLLGGREMRTVDEVFDKYETDLFTGDMAMIETRNQAKLALKEIVESKKKTFDSQVGSTEQSDKNVRIYNKAISQIAEMFI